MTLHPGGSSHLGQVQPNQAVDFPPQEIMIDTTRYPGLDISQYHVGDTVRFDMIGKVTEVSEGFDNKPVNPLDDPIPRELRFRLQKIEDTSPRQDIDMFGRVRSTEER